MTVIFSNAIYHSDIRYHSNSMSRLTDMYQLTMPLSYFNPGEMDAPWADNPPQRQDALRLALSLFLYFCKSGGLKSVANRSSLLLHTAKVVQKS